MGASVVVSVVSFAWPAPNKNAALNIFLNARKVPIYADLYVLIRFRLLGINKVRAFDSLLHM